MGAVDSSAGTLIIEGGMLAIATLSIIGAGIWKLSDVRDELKSAIEKHKEEVNDDLEALRLHTGEALTALRERVTQIELYIRDNYVRKDSFNLVIERLMSEFKSLRESVENKFLLLENEIKTLGRERSQGPHQPI